jgi:hypothetical protein
MESITLKQAKERISKFNNQHLFNFIMQRQSQDEPSKILKHAIEVARDRLTKEHVMLWSGKKFKDEPLQDIIDKGKWYTMN